MTIMVVDYGIGNLRSVVKALEFLGCQVRLTSDPDEVVEADKLVLPGVGAFGAGMENLRRLGLVEAICDAVKRGTPCWEFVSDCNCFLTKARRWGDTRV